MPRVQVPSLTPEKKQVGVRYAGRASAHGSGGGASDPGGDEDVFVDPFRFDVARSPNEHLAFGFGAHFCLGNSLARLEISVMLEQIQERLPDLALADPAAPVEMRPANFISGVEHLPVTFTPSAPVG